MARFDAPSAEGEAKTQACSIDPPLLERPKQLVDIPSQEPAALVLDFDEHAVGAGAGSVPSSGGHSRIIRELVIGVDAAEAVHGRADQKPFRGAARDRLDIRSVLGHYSHIHLIT